MNDTEIPAAVLSETSLILAQLSGFAIGVATRFESRRYIPSPARREAIGGKVIGLPDRRDPMWWRVGRGVIVVCAVYALKIAVVG